MVSTNIHIYCYEYNNRDKKGEMEMSDSWILCPKCGEELEYLYEADCYFCLNCNSTWNIDETRKVSTEYLKEEEGYRK